MKAMQDMLTRRNVPNISLLLAEGMYDRSFLEGF
jgi:hypothetical protein